MYDFNDDGPVNGPNGEWELDPDNDQCNSGRPVFATCKNNCPGGESSVLSVLNYFLIITNISGQMNFSSVEKIYFPPIINFYGKIVIILFSVNFPVVGGEAV